MCARISEKDIDRLVTKYRFENSEKEFTRLPSDRENTIMEMVRAGRYRDAIRLQRLSENILHLGQLADDPKKNLEYYAAIIIAFSSRAAIEGGMPQENALDLSDVLLQKLSRLTTVEEIEDFVLFSVAAFAKAVSVTRRRTSVYPVEQSKAFIDRNIYRNISVTDVAAFVGLSAEHLSRLFRKTQGITIHHYIQREKINAACNILRYTDRSIAEVAAETGFASHSNFGQVFRTWKGMTPREYRNQYRVSQFTEPEKDKTP